jgi:D-serine deaminase-like pyridoxal phosphate-dependent protein
MSSGIEVSRRRFLGSAAGGAVGMSLFSNSHAEGRAFEPIHLSEPVSLWDLPTPALVVDLDAMEGNLRKMASFYQDKKAGIRPHTKTHKCPVIAKKQMELGAVGICTAKVSEAEVMVAEGLGEVLISSPVVTKDKIERVIKLAQKSPGVHIVVDQPANVRDLNEAAAAAGIKLGVFIDLNVGQDRTGVAMGDPAIALLEEIDKSPSLAFGGFQAYGGHLQHMVGWQYRHRCSREALSRALEVKYRAEKSGYEVPVFSVGGTGTYNVDCDIEGVTDVQVGSYLFMDVNYRNVGGKEGRVFTDFAPSLLVLATAVSQPAKGRITIDAGIKSFAADKEPPELLNIQGVSYRFGGDEHGILQFKNPSQDIKIGDKVLLIASHCDPTVNLYDQFYTFRGETVGEAWPVAARGHSQ